MVIVYDNHFRRAYAAVCQAIKALTGAGYAAAAIQGVAAECSVMVTFFFFITFKLGVE